MKPLNFIYILLITSVLVSCKIEPKPIEYGTDACHYCSMNIVDARYASEIVTAKGKVYKYDAIECMMNDQSVLEKEIALYLVMDFNSPNSFMDARESVYLICEELPSPMGANLSAFKQRSEADSMNSSKGGQIYSWQQLKKQKLVVME